MGAFSLGGSTRERIEIAVSGSSDPEGWINARVSLAVRGFSGDYSMSIQLRDLTSFRDELQTLYRTLNGEAQFHTTEDQLSLCLIGDRLGGVTLVGEARDMPGDGNALTFELAIDQTYLAVTIEELNAVIDTMAVRAG